MPHLNALLDPWLVIGFAGQILFFGRFLVQWLHSERLGRSVIPVSFWYMSLGGGLLLLAYSIYRRDPVFITGQLVGGFAYVRNLVLIRRHAAASEPVPPL